MKQLFTYISRALAFLFLVSIVFSCRKEDEFTSEATTLRLSTDTVFFDTVFSQVGQNRPLSITKQLWVVNTNAKGVKVNIALKGTAAGIFKLNIDGVPTAALTGKEIRGNDSIVIFVQAYLNQGNSNTPFIVTDQLLFETNGTSQDVDLVAWGQDAHYLNDSILAVANHVWTDDKPYVIYNSVLVPKGATLTINEGTKVHSHVKSTFYVQGTLIINGTKDKPVIFQGDRLDPYWRDNAGQWIGIRLLPGSVNNQITYTIIKNGVVGLEADSLSSNANPNLILQNSIIQNMAAAGLVGYSSKIVAINNVINNCSQFTFYGALGGNYTLYHNTFANYGIGFNRQTPQFVLDNSPFKNAAGAIVAKFPLDFDCVNNIIYGSQEEELVFNNAEDGEQSFTIHNFSNNLIRTAKIKNLPNTNIINADPIFENSVEFNYSLKSNSPAKGKGVFITGIDKDISGNPRNTSKPTIGAYE